MPRKNVREVRTTTGNNGEWIVSETLQAAPVQTPRSLDTTAQKTTFVPIRVPRDAIEAYRKGNPLFTEFLLESGRVIIENVPGQLAGAQRNDIRATSQ